MNGIKMIKIKRPMLVKRFYVAARNALVDANELTEENFKSASRCTKFCRNWEKSEVIVGSSSIFAILHTFPEYFFENFNMF